MIILIIIHVCLYCAAAQLLCSLLVLRRFGRRPCTCLTRAQHKRTNRTIYCMREVEWTSLLKTFCVFHSCLLVFHFSLTILCSLTTPGRCSTIHFTVSAWFAKIDYSMLVRIQPVNWRQTTQNHLMPSKARHGGFKSLTLGATPCPYPKKEGPFVRWDLRCDVTRSPRN